MNTSLSAYTNLESLLLFQSLNAYGVGHTIFSRISDLLKNNPSINQDRRFQSGRLSPDALRSFYLQIVKEEIKSEHKEGGADGDGSNGEVKNTRKRKAPSPSLPSVQEAAQHAHLLPKLVTKLYARYRNALTNEIRDEEDKYERLQRELASIERGQRDKELLERHNRKSPASRSPSVARKSPSIQQRPLPPSPSPQPVVQDESSSGTPSANTHIMDGVQQTGMEPPRQTPSNGQVQPDRNVKDGPSPRKKHPGPTPTPSAPSTPQPPAGQPQQIRTPHSQGQPPLFPQPQPPNVAYSGPPPQPHPSPYAPPGPQTQGQIPHFVPTTQSAHLSPQPSLSAPIPSPGPQVPQVPPQGIHPHQAQTQSSQPQPIQQPIQPYGGNGVPQYGPSHPPHLPPNAQRYQGPHPSTPQSPNVQTPLQQRNFQPYTPQPSYPGQQSHVGPPPPQGGFMLPPFQVSPQDPVRAIHQQLLRYSQMSTPVARQHQTPIRPGTASTGGFGSTQPPLHVSVHQARGPISTPLSTRSSAQGTPRSAKTVWKSSAKSFGTPPVARPEVSPIDDIKSPAQADQATPKTKSIRKPRGKSKAKEKEIEKEADKDVEPDREPEEAEEEVPEMETRQSRSRRKAAGKRARRGSITSSQAGGSVRERSRSQSIISHTETIAAENESQAGTRVKMERAASVDVGDNDSVGTASHPATRRRGGTLQASSNRGRKRNAREASLPESEDRPSPDFSDAPKIIAPRHFSRMAHPVMNEISSHKHASIFTTAVKPKDAEGYYEIIKRPTDLKSITKAITVGSKVVAAAASDTPAGSPGGGGGIVELPASADTTPPKAIVNSAQLEKELMRMFVNAVMFNSGEEGVVTDAREMFASTERSVSNWRNAERSKGRLEVEDLATLAQTPEEEGPPVEKKRRKG